MSADRGRATIGNRAAGLLLAMVLTFTAWLGAAAGPPAVSASCATAMSTEDAVALGQIVFVGTVGLTTNDGRWAQVRVEERWKGADDLPEIVEVRGGPEAGVATGVDRAYLPGRYLFMVEQGVGYLVDDACSGTTPWTDDLARIRPGSNQAGETPADQGDALFEIPEVTPAIALLLALVIAVLAYLLVLRARKRPPDWMR
jgi:hypothetical protein